MEKQRQLENLGVKFIPINSLQVEIRFPNKNFQIIVSKERKSVVYENIEISTSDVISKEIDTSHGYYNMTYKISEISKLNEDSNSVYTSESVTNRATLFILPLLFEDRECSSLLILKKDVFFGYLVNCYIDCIPFEKKDKYSIFLLLKFSKSSRYKAQEGFFVNHDSFVKHLDCGNSHVLFEFSIPEIYRNDFDLLLDGKYSELNPNTKKRIIDFHLGKKTKQGKLVDSVMNKDEKLSNELSRKLNLNLRKMNVELFSKFNEDDILFIN